MKNQLILFMILLFFFLFPSLVAAQDDPVRQCEAGVELFHAGKSAQAFPLLEAGFEARQNGDFTEEELGYCAYAFALLSAEKGDQSKALEAHNLALDIFQSEGNREATGLILSNMGAVYADLKQYEDALKSYKQALTIAEEIGDQIGAGIRLNQIGLIYKAQMRYVEALTIYQQALAIFRTIDNRTMESVLLLQIGTVYQVQDYNDEALESYEHALSISREEGDLSLKESLLNKIGGIYQSTGQYRRASENYKLALRLARENDNRRSEGMILSNIGGVYHSQAHYGDALKTYLQALVIARNLEDLYSESTILNNIGIIYREQGRYEEAIDIYQQSLIVLTKQDRWLEQGLTLNNLGKVYELQEQFGKALSTYQEALAIAMKVNNQSSQSAILNNMGWLYHRQGQHEQALDAYQQGLAISRAIGDKFNEGATLNDIGWVYVARREYETALDYFEQALVIAREVGNQSKAGATLNNIGFVHETLQQPEKALLYDEQALDVIEDVRATAGSERGRAGFIAQFNSLYQRLVNLHHRLGHEKKAWFTAERGRARSFLDSLATGYVQLSDATEADLLAQEQETFVQLQAVKDRLTQAKNLTPEDTELLSSLEVDLAEAETVYTKVQNVIAARGAELTSLIPDRSADIVLSVEQVQPLLNEQTTLLSYYQLEDDILAFILTSDSFETVALNVEPAEVIQQINAFREFASTTAAHPASAVKLYEMLVAPLKDKLPSTDSGQGPRPHLTIIPHQSLHYLPFAALTDGERYLIDDYTLTVLPSASALPFILENTELEEIGRSQASDTIVLTPQSDKLTGKNQDYDTLLPASEIDHIPILVIGNPVTADYDTVASLATTRDLLGSLPFAEKEAKAIAELFGVKPLIGEAATESAVREQAPQADILHLAAHGQFNPVAPLNSLIALAPDEENDGWLTVGESYGLDLENTDLVVLSACETNLGDLSAGDELVGLTRALIFAGTPSVIASLWAVEDKATSLLMERFYTHLKDGVGKAEALRQAQIEVREEYPNPYYWSGFVLSGAGE